MHAQKNAQLKSAQQREMYNKSRRLVSLMEIPQKIHGLLTEGKKECLVSVYGCVTLVYHEIPMQSARRCFIILQLAVSIRKINSVTQFQLYTNT